MSNTIDYNQAYDNIVHVAKQLELERSTLQTEAAYADRLDARVQDAVKNSLGLIKLYTLFKTTEYCTRSSSKSSPLASMKMSDVFKENPSFYRSSDVKISFAELYYYAQKKAEKEGSATPPSIEEISKEFILATYKAGMQASVLITRKIYLYCIFKLVNFFCTHILLRAQGPLIETLFALPKEIQDGFSDTGKFSKTMTALLKDHKEILNKCDKPETSEQIDRLWREKAGESKEKPLKVKKIYKKFETLVINSCFPPIKISSFAKQAIIYVNKSWFKNIFLDSLHKILSFPIQIILTVLYINFYILDIILTWTAKQISIIIVNRLQVAESCLDLVHYDTHTSSISTGVSIAINQLLELLISTMRTMDSQTSPSDIQTHAFSNAARENLNALVRSLLDLTDFEQDSQLRQSIEGILPKLIEKVIYQCDARFMKERYIDLLGKLDQLMTRCDDELWPTPQESNRAEAQLKSSISQLTEDIVYGIAAEKSPYLFIHPTHYTPIDPETKKIYQQNIIDALQKFAKIYQSLSQKSDTSKLIEGDAEDERLIYNGLVVNGSVQCFSSELHKTYLEILNDMPKITSSIKQSGLTDENKRSINALNSKINGFITQYQNSLCTNPKPKWNLPVSEQTTTTLPATNAVSIVAEDSPPPSIWHKASSLFSTVKNSAQYVTSTVANAAGFLSAAAEHVVPALQRRVIDMTSRAFYSDPEGPKETLNKKILHVSTIIQEKGFLTAFIRQVIVIPATS